MQSVTFRELADQQLAALAAQERESATGCPWGDGAHLQRERLAVAATWCAGHFAGDLIEIGCYLGETSRILAGIAAKFGRRLVCVDPWQPGTQNCSGGEYEQFQSNTRPLRQHIDVLRASSLDAIVQREVGSRSLCFAWVDGLHTETACRQDIYTVSHCAGIIAVDDIREIPEVRSAFFAAARLLDLIAVHNPSTREGYLCKLAHLDRPRRETQ